MAVFEPPTAGSVTLTKSSGAKVTASGSFVEEKSELGKQITQLARGLVEARAPVKGGKRKFLEQFSVSSSPALQR